MAKLLDKIGGYSNAESGSVEERCFHLGQVFVDFSPDPMLTSFTIQVISSSVCCSTTDYKDHCFPV